MRTLTVSEAITRLEHLLPVHEPDLWASLQPPATPEAVDALRATIAPHDLPSDIVELLSWRNGGPWGGPWWPILECVHLLSTDEIIDHYGWLCENTDEWQWCRSWLPIAHEGWNQCGIELDGEQRGLVVNGSFPDPPVPWAPSRGTENTFRRKRNRHVVRLRAIDHRCTYPGLVTSREGYTKG